jgi:hypothetical protein
MVEAIYAGDRCGGARGGRRVEDHFGEKDAGVCGAFGGGSGLGEVGCGNEERGNGGDAVGLGYGREGLVIAGVYGCACADLEECKKRSNGIYPRELQRR